MNDADQHQRFQHNFPRIHVMSAHNLMQFVTIGIIGVVSLFVPFALLHAQTQSAMNAQARAEFVQADAELNKTYQSVLVKLPTVESKQKLREEQRAWVGSREAEAARAAKEAEGGSMAPTLRYEMMTRLTRDRIKELKASLRQGAAPEEKDANTAKPLASSTAEPPASASESKREQARSVSETPEPTASSSPSSVSPDKKWEYESDESDPKIVKAGTNEVALDLSDQPAGNGFSFATVIWAPDSKRFAFNYGQGREHATSLYQLRGNEWKALKLPDDDDKILRRADNIVAEQLKRTGLSKEKLSKKGMYLRLIWWTVQLDRWVDSNTAILYASLRQVAARRDNPGEMSDGFGTDLLLTLKFDEAGNWKIIKTHEMSEKEVEKREKEQ
jgi:uncharacterized protein YecT (DUF1311 family)